MTTTGAILFLRRNALGTIPRNRATVVAKVFGRTLSDLGSAFRSSGRVPVPELACALAGIEVETPTHPLHLSSQWNAERATLRLPMAAQPSERAATKAAANIPDPYSEELAATGSGVAKNLHH